MLLTRHEPALFFLLPEFVVMRILPCGRPSFADARVAPLCVRHVDKPFHRQEVEVGLFYRRQTGHLKRAAVKRYLA